MTGDTNYLGARADRGFFGGGDPGDVPEPPEQWDDRLACTHCGGEGVCWDGSDPNRDDQVFF